MRETGGSMLRDHQKTLVLAAVVSLILWVTPVFGFVMLPLQYLNAHLHEFSHAVMMMLTGGEVETIRVFANGSGITLGSGSMLLVSPAGYLGATLIGALMIWFSRSERGAANTSRTVAGILLFSMVFWVRGDAVGFVAGLVWMLILLFLPNLLKGRNLVFGLQFLGMQQCLASVQSLYILYRISAMGEGQSDAGAMSQYTGVPATVWATLWGLIGLATLWFTLRASWSRQPRD